MAKKKESDMKESIAHELGTSSSKEKKSSKSISSKKDKMTAKQREELLIENFVGLQHAMTNLSVKFGMLSDNITSLLRVFEESAKSFVEGGHHMNNKDMINKIDSLLDQNKTIARGLVLMEGKLRGRPDSEPPRSLGPPVPPPRGPPQAFSSVKAKQLPRI